MLVLQGVYTSAPVSPTACPCEKLSVFHLHVVLVLGWLKTSQNDMK